MEGAVLKSSKIFNSVSRIGWVCLILAVALTILQAFLPLPNAQPLISMLSDGFKLCLGAILAALDNSAGATR
jgi:hypothetical protein